MSLRSPLFGLTIVGLVLLASDLAAVPGYDDPPPPTEQAGQLRLGAASYSASEGAGSFRVTVQRGGGDDGVVSVDWSVSAGSANPGSDYQGGSGTLTWPDGGNEARTFTVTILDDALDEANETINVTLSGPDGGATLGDPSSATLTIVDDDSGSAAGPGKVGFVDSGMSAGEDGGEMAVEVRRQDGTAGAISVHYATADGSADAGSDYASAAGTLQWADGQGGIRSFPLSILDDAAEEGNETINLALSLPTGGATLGASTATVTVADDDAEAPPLPDSCTPDSTTLCLANGDRFLVRVDFTRPGGVPEPGRTVDFGSANSGLFFFFDASNIEMLVKVLDACGLAGFDNYWVFYAATTSVQFTLTVVDTERQQVKTYTNAQGNAAKPVLDTAAFDTCP